MTQLVGRVLRQPDAERTPFTDLNESYVFCRKQRAAEIAQQVKKALEQEGYEGGLMSVVDRRDTGVKPDGEREAAMRPQFRRFYKEFEGTVYLPRFCVRRNGSYEPLDYFRHLIGEVDVTAFDYASPDWDFSRELEAARDAYYRITLGEEMGTVRQESATAAETDEQVKQWLVASLDFDYYSYKQLREIVGRATRELLKRAPQIRGQLSLVKFPLRNRITGLIERQTDQQTQAVFETLYKKKSLCFYLECREARFEIPPRVSIRATKCLVQEDNAPLQRSLFDCVADDLNTYERSVALYLDNHPEVLWWYRNLVGPECFAIQGYRRNKIYPDFVVQQGKRNKPVASVLVVESKGKQLKGNEDTKYKKTVAEYFGKVGRKVRWQKLGKDFQDQTFRVQVLDEGEYEDRDWKADLRKQLGDPLA